MDQLGAIAPQYLAEINGIDAARELIPALPTLLRLHTRTSVCAEPRDMLIPERRATPFLGRGEEMAILRAWLSGSARVAVQHVIGGAGTGKTRLAIELCAWAEARGWDSGFITAGSVASFAMQRRLSPLLVVLDDMEPWCGAWLSDQWADGPPLRIIVIERDAEPRAEMGGIIGAVAADVSEPLRLGDLRTNDERLGLLSHAISMAAGAAGLPACLPHSGTTLDRGEPLYLLMAGLIAPHAGIKAALSETSATLAHRFAMQGRSRLERLGPILGLDPRLLWHIAACVTLQAGCPVDAAGALVHEEASALAFHLPASCDEVTDAIADALGSVDCDLLAPIGPRPVGAAFLIDEIGRHSPETQAGIIERAHRRAPAAVTLAVRRIARDHANGDAPHLALQWRRQIGA